WLLRAGGRLAHHVPSRSAMFRWRQWPAPSPTIARLLRLPGHLRGRLTHRPCPGTRRSGSRPIIALPPDARSRALLSTLAKGVRIAARIPARIPAWPTTELIGIRHARPGTRLSQRTLLRIEPHAHRDATIGAVATDHH